MGLAGASARAIAHQGEFYQALIFYHFGSVQTVLLAAFDLVSDRRMQEYGPQIEAAASAPALARLARLIYDDDPRSGCVAALGEVEGGWGSDRGRGAEVAPAPVLFDDALGTKQAWPPMSCAIIKTI